MNNNLVKKCVAEFIDILAVERDDLGESTTHTFELSFDVVDGEPSNIVARYSYVGDTGLISYDNTVMLEGSLGETNLVVSLNVLDHFYLEGSIEGDLDKNQEPVGELIQVSGTFVMNTAYFDWTVF